MLGRVFGAVTADPWRTVFYAVTLGSIFLIEILCPIPQDVKTQFNWLIVASERGLFKIYNWPTSEFAARFDDFAPNYPPLTFYLWYPLYYLFSLFGLEIQWPSHGINLVFRLPIYAAHVLATVAVRNEIARRYPDRAWLTWIVLGMNPALLLGGPFWGQWDVLLWLFVFLSVRTAQRGEYARAGLWAALGALTKPQFILMVPVIGLAWLISPKAKLIPKGLGAFAATLVVLTSPFMLSDGMSWFMSGYGRALEGEYSLTVTAFNFWWLVRSWLGVTHVGQTVLGIGTKPLGVALTACAALIPVVVFFRRQPRGSILPVVALYLLCCYAFLPGMSARFLLFGLLWTLLWAIEVPRLRPAAGALIATEIAALFYYPLFAKTSRFFLGLSPTATELVTSGASLCLLVAFAWLVWQYVRGTDSGILRPIEPIGSSGDNTERRAA